MAEASGSQKPWGKLVRLACCGSARRILLGSLVCIGGLGVLPVGFDIVKVACTSEQEQQRSFKVARTGEQEQQRGFKVARTGEQEQQHNVKAARTDEQEQQRGVKAARTGKQEERHYVGAYNISEAAIRELVRSFPSEAQCSSNSRRGAPPSTPGASRTDYELAYRESAGFMEEPEDMWQLRRHRHIGQMCSQGAVFKTCPQVVHCRQCWVGCAPFPAEDGCSKYCFWQIYYEPSFSCIFEQRIGPAGDGGKWVCDPQRLAAKSKREGCLVYAIGSNGDYNFEAGLHGVADSCEIHTVDMHDWRAYTKTPPPDYVNYHVFTLGAEPQRSLRALVKQLGHQGRTIDILKIDCDGCEWTSYASWFESDVYIRQVLVELHGFGRGRAHELFKKLFDLGYVIFHKEPNTYGAGGRDLEYAFLRLSPAFSRAGAGAI